MEQLELLEIWFICNQLKRNCNHYKTPTLCSIPSVPAARTRFISPSGWPSRAIAAGAINIGSELGSESIFDAVDTRETLFRLLDDLSDCSYE